VAADGRGVVFQRQNKKFSPPLCRIVLSSYFRNIIRNNKKTIFKKLNQFKMKKQSYNLSTSDLAERLVNDLYKIVAPIVKRADGGELFAEADEVKALDELAAVIKGLPKTAMGTCISKEKRETKSKRYIESYRIQMSGYYISVYTAPGKVTARKNDFAANTTIAFCMLVY
jgi:hypothetical protein